MAGPKQSLYFRRVGIPVRNPGTTAASVWSANRSHPAVVAGRDAEKIDEHAFRVQVL